MSEQQFLIAKANRKYRDSFLAPINPRSRTEVREGSMGRRGARRIGGGVAGSVAGGVAGGVGGKLLKLNPETAARVSGLSSGIGGSIGTSVGRTHNLKSGDTRATNRRTGKKARGNTTVRGYGSYWNY